MKTGSGDLGSAGEPSPRGKSPWPLSRWLLLIVLVLAAHVVLIFMFGGRKPITPRATTDGRLQDEEDWTLLETRVEREASIGSGAVILGGVTIGASALVGAGAVVTKDVAPGETVAGVPARTLSQR